MLIHKLQCLRMETLARAWRSLTNKISIHRRFAAQAGNIWKKKNSLFLNILQGGATSPGRLAFTVLPDYKTEKAKISGLPSPAPQKEGTRGGEVQMTSQDIGRSLSKRVLQ